MNSRTVPLPRDDDGARLGRALYPLGFFGLMFSNTLFSQWVVFSRASSAAIGAVASAGAMMMGGYLVQGLVNPFLGLAGDHLRARWGSRKPLIVVGAPLLLVAYVSVWRATAHPAWVLAYCALFVLVMQPYMSLVSSVAPGEALRTKTMFQGLVFALAGAATALVGGPLIVQRLGTDALAAIGAVAFVVTTLVPTLLVREAPRAAGAATSLAPGHLRDVLATPGTLRFVIGTTFLTATQMAFLIAGPFVAGALLLRGQAATAALNGSLVVGLALSIPLVARRVRRTAPFVLLRAGAWVAATAMTGLGLASLAPGRPLTVVACGASFVALGYVALTVVAIPSLAAARLAAEGRDREGLFFGLSGLANGLGNALGAFAASALLASHTLEGVRATIAFAGLAALAAALALPRPPK